MGKLGDDRADLADGSEKQPGHEYAARGSQSEDAESRQIEGHGAEQQSAQQPGQKHGGIGGEEGHGVVSQKLLHVFKGLSLTDHMQNVALAQTGMPAGRTVEAVAGDARNLHAVDMLQIEGMQGLSGNLGPGQENFLLGQDRAERHVRFHLWADDHGGAAQGLPGSDCADGIAHAQHRVGPDQLRRVHSAPQQAGDGHFVREQGQDLGQGRGTQIGIGHAQMRELHERVQPSQLLFQLFLFMPDVGSQNPRQQFDRQHHADDAEGVGHAIGRRSRAVAGQFHGHGQTGGGCQGAGEKTGGDLLGKTEPGLAAQGGEQGCGDHAQSGQTQGQPFTSHGVQKSRPGLLSDGVDEKDQAQTLKHSGQREAGQTEQQPAENNTRSVQGKSPQPDSAQQISGQDHGQQQKERVLQKRHGGSGSLRSGCFQLHRNLVPRCPTNKMQPEPCRGFVP